MDYIVIIANNYRWDIEAKNLLAISRSVIFDKFVSHSPESSYHESCLQVVFLSKSRRIISESLETLVLASSTFSTMNHVLCKTDSVQNLSNIPVLLWLIKEDKEEHLKRNIVAVIKCKISSLKVELYISLSVKESTKMSGI